MTQALFSRTLTYFEGPGHAQTGWLGVSAGRWSWDVTTDGPECSLRHTHLVGSLLCLLLSVGSWVSFLFFGFLKFLSSEMETVIFPSSPG